MNLENELRSLHEELEQTNLLPYITSKQAQFLASTMGKCIKNKKQSREIRLYALNRIASDALWQIANVREIISTKTLTGTMAKVLLDLFLEDEDGIPDEQKTYRPSSYGKRLIEALENEFEKDNRTGEDKSI